MKTASTCTVGIISTTPSMTSLRVRTLRVSAMTSSTGFLKCGGGEHGHGLGMVELQAFGFPLERDISQGMNHELVELARSKVHMDLLCTVCNTHCMNVTRMFHDEYITS